MCSIMFQSKNGTKRSNESKESLLKHPKKKMKSLLEKFKGLRCTDVPSLHISAPKILRSEDTWEVKNLESMDSRKRKKTSRNQRNIPNNFAVGVHNICCTPRGIGIGSDFAPATRPVFRRKSNRKHFFVDQGNGDGLSPNLAIMSPCIPARTYHYRSERELTERMLLHQNLLFRRELEDKDQYGDWRLDIDDMSYEDLVALGDEIGFVGSGLQEEEILKCIKKYKYPDLSTSMVSTGNTDWRCSICQEKCRDNEIGALECGHYHHVGCIKQWLQLKNACPICKIPALGSNLE